MKLETIQENKLKSNKEIGFRGSQTFEEKRKRKKVKTNNETWRKYLEKLYEDKETAEA